MKNDPTESRFYAAVGTAAIVWSVLGICAAIGALIGWGLIPLIP